MELEGVAKGFGDIGRVGWMDYYYAALEGLVPSWLGSLRSATRIGLERADHDVWLRCGICASHQGSVKRFELWGNVI